MQVHRDSTTPPSIVKDVQVGAVLLRACRKCGGFNRSLLENLVDAGEVPTGLPTRAELAAAIKRTVISCPWAERAERQRLANEFTKAGECSACKGTGVHREEDLGIIATLDSGVAAQLTDPNYTPTVIDKVRGAVKALIRRVL